MFWLLLQIIWTFMKIGFVSFGGGYAMIPVIEQEVISQGWLTDVEYAQVVSLAGMAPGPVATNVAAIVGYRVQGLSGAVTAAIGTLLPSFIIILIICLFLYRAQRFQLLESVFYGLRPVITGLIVYAGLRYAQTSGLLQWNWQLATGAALFLIILIALVRFRLHPLIAIVASGIIGILLYA